MNSNFGKGLKQRTPIIKNGSENIILKQTKNKPPLLLIYIIPLWFNRILTSSKYMSLSEF